MYGYFTKGSNWLQLRPPVIICCALSLWGEGRGEGEAYFARCSLIRRLRCNLRHCKRKRTNLVLKIELPQVCFHASSRKKDTDGPKETRQKDKTGPRRTRSNPNSTRPKKSMLNKKHLSLQNGCIITIYKNSG